MNWREFRQVKGKKTQVWKIRQEGETYFTEHGHLGGAQQTFSDIPGDKGKPGTKAYVSAVDNCTFNLEREVRKKTEAGYVEFVNGQPVEEQITEIKWSQFLPKNFTPLKPQTDIDTKTLKKIHDAGLARYSRKIDGMCHLAAYHAHGWEIYSRRIDLASERFPNHIKHLEQLDFSPGTLFVGEMISLGLNGREDFKAISSICRSLPEETRKIIKEGKYQEPVFVIFDMIFINGKDLKSTSYDERAKLWRKLFSPLKDREDDLIVAVDYYDVTPDNWEETAKNNRWEGFVVVDGSSIPGDKLYSYDGTAKRPKGHHKLKPISTTDVVVYAAEYGSGKRLGKVGALFVKQINPETGIFFDCGKVGSGMTDDDINELTKLCHEMKLPILENTTESKKIDLQHPCNLVVEIEFSERQEGTFKFRFPVFKKIHEDKKAEECVASI